ncbi:MAG TPA: hypothetical protein VEH04_12090 [Verrucomicrobiae bacterium]|nr:hypothetical protein [Verrucomicrobiae bacterium]
MKRYVIEIRWMALLLIAAGALACTGCASTESENLSSRPWNSPRGWETGGLPSSLNEGR